MIQPGSLVRLHNPGGYPDYRGKVTAVEYIAKEDWAFVDWVLPMGGICGRQIQVKHLREVEVYSK